MALQQAVGASIGVSVTLPSTYDAAGYGALTMVRVGRPSSLPDLTGVYDIASFDDLSTGEELKFADMLRAGEGTFTLGYDTSDTGQIAIEGAVGDKAAFCFTLKSGVKYYRTAVIKSYMPTNVVAGGVVQSSVSLAFEGTAIKVAA